MVVGAEMLPAIVEAIVVVDVAVVIVANVTDGGGTGGCFCVCGGGRVDDVSFMTTLLLLLSGSGTSIVGSDALETWKEAPVDAEFSNDA